jgi:hypothetical protein
MVPVLGAALVSTVISCLRAGGVLERLVWFVGVGACGTLLGPEATGPGRRLPRTGWFWFPCRAEHTVIPFGGVCGVCGVGLLFENYIVDASIL